MPRKNLIAMLKNGNDFSKSFLSSLERTIEESQEERLPSRTIRPSSLRCSRQAVFQLLGKPQDKETPSASLVGICDSGTDIHQRIQEYCLKMKSWKFINVAEHIKEHNLPLEVKKDSNFENHEFETKLYEPERNISFLCDGIIENKGKRFILEIKSIGNQGMFKLEDIPEYYREQAITYSQLLQIPSIIFLFVNRDLFNKKSFMYTPSRAEIRNWQDKIENILKCAKDEKIPKKENIEKRICSFCRYKTICDEYS